MAGMRDVTTLVLVVAARASFVQSRALRNGDHDHTARRAERTCHWLTA